MSFDHLLHGDAVATVVKLGLLAMSVLSWVLILWKTRLLRRALHDLARATAAFWQSESLAAAGAAVAPFDRERIVLPLVQASQHTPQGTLAAAGDRSQQLTRALRDALHAVLHRLQAGQTMLATIGATAPFVGLLGTVWGIYTALTAIAGAGQIHVQDIAGPVGEALVMTAAGLAVAIPAVLAYNLQGRTIARIEVDLEGFAYDLHALLAGPP